jgi:tyrosyl-tRNA synthetase
MVNNNDWLDGLGYLSFLRDYGRFFTVNRMLSFDSVKLRLERESPLTTARIQLHGHARL